MLIVKKKKISIVLFAIFIVGSFLLGIFDRKATTVVSDIKINKGDSIWEIGKKLEKKKIISSRYSFIFLVYKNNKQKKMKAGDYLLSSDLNVSEIIKIISSGNVVSEKKRKKITFPEGWTSKQMAERLSENGFNGNDFLKKTKNSKYFLDKYDYNFLKSIPQEGSLEGFLFPDTYFFANNATSEEIIKKMLDNFDTKVSSDLKKEIEKQNKSIYEIVTMASILEREVKTSEDKRVVSGIFWKRLDNGQAFQSCATLAYILGKNKKQYSYTDTKIKSPYNTYLHTGLPPGPISNPGLDSILAAIYPQKTEYNYFLNNPDTGKTVFSKTLQEHNLNKKRNGL